MVNVFSSRPSRKTNMATSKTTQVLLPAAKRNAQLKARRQYATINDTEQQEVMAR